MLQDRQCHLRNVQLEKLGEAGRALGGSTWSPSQVAWGPHPGPQYHQLLKWPLLLHCHQATPQTSAKVTVLTRKSDHHTERQSKHLAQHSAAASRLLRNKKSDSSLRPPDPFPAAPTTSHLICCDPVTLVALVVPSARDALHAAGLAPPGWGPQILISPALFSQHGCQPSPRNSDWPSVLQLAIGAPTRL